MKTSIFLTLYLSLIIVIRMHSQGSVIHSYNYDAGINIHNPSGVAFQSNGKILVASPVATSYHQLDVSLVRLLPNLNIDISFRSNYFDNQHGFKYFRVSNEYQANDSEEPISIVVDDSDNIIIGGNFSSGSSHKVFFFKLDKNGIYDNSFNDDGKILINLDSLTTKGLELISFGLKEDGTIIALVKPRDKNDTLIGIYLSKDGEIIGQPKIIKLALDISYLKKAKFINHQNKFYIFVDSNPSQNGKSSMFLINTDFSIDQEYGINGYLDSENKYVDFIVSESGNVFKCYNVLVENNLKSIVHVKKENKYGDTDTLFGNNGIFKITDTKRFNLNCRTIAIDEEDNLFIGNSFKKKVGSNLKDSVVIFKVLPNGLQDLSYGIKGFISYTYLDGKTYVDLLNFNINGDLISTGQVDRSEFTGGVNKSNIILCISHCNNRKALFLDNDKDGFGDPNYRIATCENTIDGFTLKGGDCDDNNYNANPLLLEIPDNSIDENCDGIIGITDEDGDGYGILEDCDDTNPNINPNEIEIYNNSIDEDCDGEVIFDLDNDGFISTEDCNDLDSLINYAALDDTINGIDENCDGIDGDQLSFTENVNSTNLFSFNQNEIIINNSDNSISSFGVYSVLGELIVKSENNEQGIFMYPMINLHNGLYFVIINKKDKTRVRTAFIKVNY